MKKETIKTTLFYITLLTMVIGVSYLLLSFKDMPTTYIEMTYGLEVLSK